MVEKRLGWGHNLVSLEVLFVMSRFNSAAVSDCSLARFAVGALLSVTIGIVICGSAAAATFIEEIRTEGEIPVDLNGVWLMAGTVEFTKDKHTTIAQLYRIKHVPFKIAQQRETTPRPTPSASADEGKILLPKVFRPKLLGDDIDIMLLDVELPSSIASKLEKLQNEKVPWVPDESELKLLAEKWSTLKPKAFSEYSRIEYRVVGPDHFDNSLKYDDATKDAKVAIIADQSLLRGPTSTGGNIILVWGVREVKPDRLEGTMVRSHLAGAPFPVSVTTYGKFVMYKLAEVPRDWETTVESSPQPSEGSPSPKPTPHAS